MKRTFSLFFLVLVGVMASAARADWTPRVQAAGAVLKVNDVVILRTRRPSGGMTPDERTQVSAERLREVTLNGLTPGEVRVDVESESRSRMETRTVTRMVERTVTRRVKKKRRRVTITVPVSRRERVRVAYEVETEARLIAQGKVIATVTAAEAQAAQLGKPSVLVDGWATALKKALAIPGIAVKDLKDNGLIIPWMEKRVLHFYGAARGPVIVQRQSGTASVVEATVDMARGTVTLSGRSVGRDVITLSREGAAAPVTIAVQPYAAQLVAPQPVILTGNGVDPSRIARLVRTSARAAVRPLPGTTLRIESDVMEVSPPGLGKSLSVPIPVTISGPEMLPVHQVLKVPVVARSFPRQETNALFFSNNPERIPEPQPLYVARLSMGHARLLYHHQNGSGQNLWFVAELINDSDEVARVQVLGTDAGPVVDTVWVGYRAASEFLTAYASDSGMVLDLPPRSRMAFQAVRLAPNLTLSGLFQVRLVSGSAPLVRVSADRPGDPLSLVETLRPYPLTEETRALVQDAARLSQHVYPQPSKTLNARHQVGGRWTFVSVGRAPIRSVDTDTALEGNYGVFYDITFTLENTTSQPANVKIVFEPAGGLAGGVFVVDGNRKEIPRTNMPTETLLANYRLRPGERRVVSLRTLPLSGSNYPVNLIVKS